MHKILITGATGFLGGALVVRALESGLGAGLLMLVRAPDQEAGLARMRETLRNFDVHEDRLASLSVNQIICGDLAAVARFAGDPRLDGVTHVINCAALATFSNNPLIWPINVDGTFAFAKRMASVPTLRRFLQVGTSMTCGPGLRSPVSESWDFPPKEKHLVVYTASKAEIERKLKTELPGLPLVVARVSIVVGHTRLGCRPSGSIFWVFRMAQKLEQFTCALDEQIDVIPADYCAEALMQLALKEPLAHDLYHVSAGLSASCSFEEIDMALAEGCGVAPVGKRYKQISEADLPLLAKDFEQRIGPCNRRLMLRALRLYGGFAALNYVFDNQRLLAEGITPSPRFASYIGECARSSTGISIPEQMRWDFK
jgi:nucleoside-diphosphate-sugar epimerase